MKEQFGHFMTHVRIKVRCEGAVWALHGMCQDKGLIKEQFGHSVASSGI